MKANELRIGNWINRKEPNGSNWTSARVTLYYLGLIEKWKEDFKPIPLTEEWLLKFGFEGVELCYCVKYKDKQFEIALNNQTSKPLWYFYVRQEKDFVQLVTDLKYVHQLQNLYFALTGEELTIK